MQTEPLQFLIDGLTSADRIVQARSAGLLGAVGAAEAVGPLVDYVTQCRYHTKTAGLSALAELGDRSAAEGIRPLVDAPNCEDDWYWIGCKSVRAGAAVTLLALGDDSGAGYLHELADKNDDVLFAFYAPAILRLSGDLDATAAIQARLTAETLLASGNIQTRKTDSTKAAMVAEALGLIGTPAARDYLRECLTSASRYVRGQAALSLLTADAGEADCQAVEAMATGDATDFARVKAAQALTKTGRDGFVATIAAAVDAGETAFDQAVAIEALGLLGASEQAEAIAARLTHADPYVRLCAIEALERIDRSAWAAKAVEGFEDESIHVRLQAAKYLASDAKGASQA